MADNQNLQDEISEQEGDSVGGQRRERRKIPGNLPYTSTPGVLKNVLDKIPDAEKPSVFNPDFLGAIFGVTGGSARPIPPLLKSMGLLNQSGAPTELYTQFQISTGRSNAAVQALKNGYSEIFKRNQYAHRLDEKGLTDLIVAVTGLPRSDKVVKAILATFQVLQTYVNTSKEEYAPEVQEQKPADAVPRLNEDDNSANPPRTLGLTYNINVVLPETTNVEVYNAIFRSIRSNLLQ